MLAFTLGGLALAQAAAVPATPPTAAAALVGGRWRTMTTEQLAAIALPPGFTAPVLAHRVTPAATADAAPSAITFYGRRRQAPDGFCVRRAYYAPVTAADRTLIGSSEFRFGDCPASLDADFAHVQPGTGPAEAEGAIRWLAEASAAARGDQPLEFDVRCVAKARPKVCARGARAALARLTAENTLLVAGLFNCKPWDVRLQVRQEEMPAGSAPSPLWDVRLVRPKGARPRLTLRWIAAPAARP